MPGWAIQLLMQLAPVVIGAVAPIITGLLERLTTWAGGTMPDQPKPAINAGIGAGLAFMAGGNPVAGIVGAQIGNRIREAMNQTKPGAPAVPAKP